MQWPQSVAGARHCLVHRCAVKITVRSVSMTNGQCRVEFDSEYGSAWGCWRGEEPPVVGRDYEVELAVPPLASPGCVIASTDEKTPALRAVSDTAIVLQGTITGQSDKYTRSLRIGSDIVLLDGECDLGQVGPSVAITVPAIELYPVDL